MRILLTNDDGVNAPGLEVLEGIARLSRYLDKPWSPPSSIAASVTDYLADGAFADQIAARLRRALAERMGATPETITELRRRLNEAPDTAAAFFQVYNTEKDLFFSLDEAIILGRKA